MAALSPSNWAIWTIVAASTGAVIIRPWNWPEAVWAALGALGLVALSLVPWREALAAIGEGMDVYLFLAGMMLLAELARCHGVFDWLAAWAARHARGSPKRLFALVYAVGTVVTVFLSNDATAVVLTPAVHAITRVAGAEPLPYLFVCAFIANAASFTLPISNPANLVVFRGHMPGLGQWLSMFLWPSVLAVAATYLALRITQRHSLRATLSAEIPQRPLSAEGRFTAWGLAAAIAALLLASALHARLGLPTCIAAGVTAAIILIRERRSPWELITQISWSVLVLVGGLFVLVAGLARTGIVQRLTGSLQGLAHHSPATAGWIAGALVALASNLMNNLPVGLIAGSAISGAVLPQQVSSALLIGVNLGPNLSVTGSLATILWLMALRREGVQVSAGRFLRLGALVMIPALVLALAAV